MKKIGIVAATEWSAAVRGKAFIVGVVLMPVLMFGSILIQKMAEEHVDTTAQKFAVIDHSQALYPELLRMAEARNTELGAGAPALEASLVETGDRSLDEIRLELSERVKNEELFAFVELPKDALSTGNEKLLYYSNHPTNDDLLKWLEAATNSIVETRRFHAAGVDQALIARLSMPVLSENLGLLARNAAGRIVPAEKVDKIATFVVPMALMALLFVIVFVSAPQLLNSVFEEKMSRVSEVLLGSVTPFELMMGKLLGSVGVSMALAILYVGGGVATLSYLGMVSLIPWKIMPTFFVFMAMAVWFYGSVFIAIGAACNELKDAQNMMMPIMILVMLPMYLWTLVMKAPSSALAVGASIFPSSAPFLMLFRLSLTPGPPAWQVVLALVSVIAATVICVWAAGKVLRVGLLAQGKSASFGEMLRWIRAR